MSYDPSNFSAPSGNAMALLSGAQSLANGSPTASTTAAAWVTLPPTTTDGVSFSKKILMRAVPVSQNHCRSRVGDANDLTNYKEQAGVYTWLSGTTFHDLYEFSSDDECVFFRDVPSTILLEEIEGVRTGSGYEVQFSSTYNHSLVWRLEL